MKRERITSIDALRAMTLLGIVIVHCLNGFGCKYVHYHEGLDYYLYRFIDLFLAHKCNTIFSILFGVSFYLILRNPLNTTNKFIWRCFLLTLFGLFNKLIYSYDALMWYGLCGMCLASIRTFKTKYIFWVFLLFLFLSFFLKQFHLGYLLFGEVASNRYGVDKQFWDILSYPYAVKDYLRIVFNGGIFGTLALFTLGYWLARKGFIENLERVVSKRVVAIFWCLYVVSFYMINAMGHLKVLNLFNNYMATFAYATTVIFIYYHSNHSRLFLDKLVPYGKLGLTNYSFQGIAGVILMGTFGLGLCQKTLSFSLLVFLSFYVLQAVFSYYWLSYFRYGPLEYAWRVLTERKKIDFRKKEII